MSEDALVRELKAPDLLTRLAAIDKAALDPQKHAKQVASLMLLYPGDAYFVLERIPRFGDFMIPPLKEMAESVPDESIRILAAIGLAHFKQPLDNRFLLRAIHDRSTYQHLACHALRWLGDQDVIPELLAELHETSATETVDLDRLSSLISCIEALGGTIPSDERTRLIAEGPPLIRKMLDAKRPG
ncbi:HEAT repeat domain-containing protein [Prosthecobacter fluviatilis]|uniref:HEAT repeat domain-containing protein n=1 Tax=Prosthecobacter fluviatilis TaxID=445931 RepID=A0ABW0KKL3_9BACT